MPHRVLIVDDEAHMIRLAELSLRNGNFTITTARNGAEAIAEVQREKPDLIIMDVIMPEMDGLQALQILKNNAETSSIPVIMLTARGHQITRQEASNTGAQAFFTKPFSPTQLLAEAKRILGQ